MVSDVRRLLRASLTGGGSNEIDTERKGAKFARR